ncbi:hypothetical protein NEOKW01_1821 [Nematocida sp. AWRm80]|nr:hypothetical protein NEOKW01_1821 [Nematocida sp. AWRm80]
MCVENSVCEIELASDVNKTDDLYSIPNNTPANVQEKALEETAFFVAPHANGSTVLTSSNGAANSSIPERQRAKLNRFQQIILKQDSRIDIAIFAIMVLGVVMVGISLVLYFNNSSSPEIASKKESAFHLWELNNTYKYPPIVRSSMEDTSFQYTEQSIDTTWIDCATRCHENSSIDTRLTCFKRCTNQAQCLFHLRHILRNWFGDAKYQALLTKAEKLCNSLHDFTAKAVTKSKASKLALAFLPDVSTCEELCSKCMQKQKELLNNLLHNYWCFAQAQDIVAFGSQSKATVRLVSSVDPSTLTCSLNAFINSTDSNYSVSEILEALIADLRIFKLSSDYYLSEYEYNNRLIECRQYYNVFSSVFDSDIPSMYKTRNITEAYTNIYHTYVYSLIEKMPQILYRPNSQNWSLAEQFINSL